MVEKQSINVETLIKEAKTTEHNEAYKLLERSKIYRIGVGARTDAPIPSFFIEIIISLSPDSNEVDLPHLEKTVECLKKLQAQKYSLTYQDGNCIACETVTSIQDLTREYDTVKKLLTITYS